METPTDGGLYVLHKAGTKLRIYARKCMVYHYFYPATVIMSEIFECHVSLQIIVQCTF